MTEVILSLLDEDEDDKLAHLLMELTPTYSCIVIQLVFINQCVFITCSASFASTNTHFRFYFLVILLQ